MAFEGNVPISGAGGSFPQEVCERIHVPGIIRSPAPHAGWLSDPPPDRKVLLTGADTDHGKFSRDVSLLFGRPVIVLHLDDIPHHRPDGKYTGEELKDRVEALKSIIAREVPSDVWKGWNYEDSATACEPTHFSLCTSEPITSLADNAPLGRRLPNRCWKKAGIVFLPERSLSPEEIWTSMAGLDDPKGRWNHRLERIPAGDSVRIYLRRHELAHIEQQHPNCNANLDDARRNLCELDADIAAFHDIRWLADQPGVSPVAHDALLENSQGVMHIRAMQSFLKYGKPYCFTVAFDNQYYDAETVNAAYERELTLNYGRNWVAAYELRLRVLGQLEIPGLEVLHERLPKDSAGIQRIIKDMAACAPEDQDIYNAIAPYFNSPFNWSGVDPARSVPLLHKILQLGEIDDSFTTRNAELVIQAVDYFKPSLLNGPVIEPAHPKTVVSPADNIPDAWRSPDRRLQQAAFSGASPQQGGVLQLG